MNITIYDAIDASAPRRQLAAAIVSLEQATGMTLTIHDKRGLLADADGKLFFPERVYHAHPYCLLGRYSRRAWNSRCENDCLREVEATARREARPFLHRCWKGGAELVVPVYHNQTLMFVLYGGVFKHQECRLDASLERVLGAEHGKLATLSDSEIEMRKDLLSLAGQGILAHALNHRNNGGALPGRKELIRGYLLEHAHAGASLQGLAKHLCLSVSRTRHLVASYFNASFQQLLLAERMDRSRTLLLSSELPLQEIATDVGMPNVYYFNRCFKNYFGAPPGVFRKSLAMRPSPGVRP